MNKPPKDDRISQNKETAPESSDDKLMWEETKKRLIEYMERKSQPPSPELRRKQERLREILANHAISPPHDKSKH